MAPRPTERLFDYNQSRAAAGFRVQQLNGFLDDPTKRIAILAGRGGVGKTKLLRDWSRWCVRPAETSGETHMGAGTADSPEQIFLQAPALLIADDAHRYTDLDQVVDYADPSLNGEGIRSNWSSRPAPAAMSESMKRCLIRAMSFW